MSSNNKVKPQKKKQVQPSQQKVFKKDDAFQTLTIINAWIGNIDTKISFALSLTGVLVGMIFSGDFPYPFKRISEVSKISELSGWEIFATLLVGVLYCTSFLSIICFMWAIIARLKKKNNISSVFFFGSIGNMELHNYRDIANKITEQELIDDLEEQIHTNSQICSQKVKWYNRGVKLLLITIILWFVCMAFRMI